MTDRPLILIVEDEAKIAGLLRDYLAQSGYRTHWIENGNDVNEWIRRNSAQLVILDLMLPGKDGLEVCREIRAHSTVPIIMVTARIDEIDRLLGLELGADDYVCKPFSPREVVARVKAMLRREQMRQSSLDTAYPGLTIDTERFAASVDGQELTLTPVEFRLLAMLAGQPGRVFSRDQLIDNIYVDRRVVSDRTVDSHIKNLRHKIQLSGGNGEMIRSIYGVGYKLD